MNTGQNLRRCPFLCSAFFVLLLSCCIVTVQHAAAKTDDQTPRTSQEVNSALDTLLAAVTDKTIPLTAENLEPLLELVVGKNATPDSLPQPSKNEAGSGIFLRDTINVPLTTFLEYCYDPAISPAALFPASVRLGHWKPGSDIFAAAPLWKQAENLNDMHILRGTEYEEITPDHFSGCYYGYDLHRLLILMPWNGKRVFISVSRQAGPSGVGLKGAIVGDDSDWEYVYTGVEGGTARAIGWMDTYMYDSASVTFFFDDETASRTRYAMFKWLKAGWAGLNVVKKSHILSGTERFLKGFKAVIESPRLPPAGEIATYAEKLKMQPEEEQIASLARYSARLEEISAEDSILKRDDFQQVLRNGGYGASLTAEQRAGVLVKQYIKHQIGKSPLAGLEQHTQPEG